MMLPSHDLPLSYPQSSDFNLGAPFSKDFLFGPSNNKNPHPIMPNVFV